MTTGQQVKSFEGNARSKDGASRFQLARHGKPDLLFSGEQLAAIHEAPAKAQNWWEFTLYKTSVGAYFLAATFHVVEGGNRMLPTVLSFATAERLLEFFQLEAASLSNEAQHMLAQASGKDAALHGVLLGNRGMGGRKERGFFTRKPHASNAPLAPARLSA